MNISETQQQIRVFPALKLSCQTPFWGTACFVVFFLSAVILQAEWRVPDADIRIRTGVEIARSHTLRVDLPGNLPGKTPTAVTAYRADGKELSATLWQTGPDTQSVEVTIPWLGRKSRRKVPGFPVELYLLVREGEAAKETPADPSRRVVQLHRLPTYLITRPFSSTEMKHMVTKYATLSRRYSYDIGAIGEVFDKDSWKQPPERRSAFLRWACTVPFPESGRIRVGANTGSVAWFVFWDGNPIGDWQSGPLVVKGTVAGNGHIVSPGLHTLEVFAVQRDGEPIPEFRLETSVSGGEWKVLTEAAMLPVRHPDSYIVETKEGNVLGKVEIDDVRSVFLRSTDRFVTLFKDISADEAGEKTGTFCTFREAVSCFGNHWGAEGLRIPEVEMKVPGSDRVLELPPRRIWAVGGTLNAYLRPSGVATVVPVGGLISGYLNGRIDAEDDEDLLKGLQLSVHAVTSTGVTENNVQQVSDWHNGPIPFSLPIEEKTSCVIAQLTLAGVPAARDVVIRVIRPDAFEDIEAQGDAVLQNGDTAVLVCDLISKIEIRLPKEKRQIGLLDDYVACSNAPEANLLPEESMAELLAETSAVGAVYRHSVDAEMTHGTRSATAKFAAYNSLLDLGPDVAVLGVGAADLREGSPVQELCLQLLYMCQAAAARGILPVLVALPPLRDVPKARSREAALLVKELAWRLSVPVLDLYSLDSLSGSNTGAFSDSYAAAGGTVILETPNNHGRRWIAAQMASELAEVLAACDIE